MRGVNKVIIVGTCGKDPDVKYSGSGMAITTVSVATTEEWKDKSGEKKSETSWHRLKFFGKIAEIAGEYLKKGSPVYVEGKIKYDKYTDKDGHERHTTDIIVDQMTLLPSGNSQGSSAPRAPARSASNVPPPAQPDFDDDLPPF